MTATPTPTGFRINLGMAMLAIALFTLALAPIAKFARTDRPTDLFFAFLFDFYILPALVTLSLCCFLKPAQRRNRAASFFWPTFFSYYVFISIIFLFLIILITIVKLK